MNALNRSFTSCSATATAAPEERHFVGTPIIRQRAPRASQLQKSSPYLFLSERGAPLSAIGFHRMVVRMGVKVRLKVHPHMLRHACGFILANRGHAVHVWRGDPSKILVAVTSRAPPVELKAAG